MVRRKGHSRRSYAWLRLMKYRLKWTRDTIPLQFKLRIKPMETKLGDSLTSEDEVERQTLAECESKGVPSNLIKPYFAFAKRVFETYMRFWYETAEQEVEQLISEFTLRGLDPNVLEQIKALMYEKASIRREIEIPLEGDYSTWTEIWEYDFPEGLRGSTYVSITFSPDYLYIHYFDDGVKRRFVIIGIADASAKFTSPSGSNYTAAPPDLGYASFFHFNTLVHRESGGSCFSVLGKYALIALNGNTKLEVWKDGVKMWTSPLASEAVSGASTYDAFGLRYDGKYVIAITDTEKLVCFEGS